MEHSSLLAYRPLTDCVFFLVIPIIKLCIVFMLFGSSVIYKSFAQRTAQADLSPFFEDLYVRISNNPGNMYTNMYARSARPPGVLGEVLRHTDRPRATARPGKEDHSSAIYRASAPAFRGLLSV